MGCFYRINNFGVNKNYPLSRGDYYVYSLSFWVWGGDKDWVWKQNYPIVFSG